MADRFVRITLEGPCKNSSGDVRDEISLRYGTEPAMLSSGSYVTDSLLNSDAIPVSERAGAPPKFTPGKPIIYTLKWSDEEMRSAIVPDYVAVHYFGDWTIKPGMPMLENMSPERTHPAEKRRIENVWGGCPREERDRMIQNHWRSLAKIGAPAVPPVIIHQLDSAYRMIPHWHYRPWENFGWDKDSYKKVVPFPNGQAPIASLDNMTPELKAQIDQYVQQQLAAALAAAAPPAASRGKAA